MASSGSWLRTISSCQLSVNPALVCFLNSCSQEENAVELSGAWELRWFYCKYSRQSKIDGSESNILKGNLMAISPFLSSSERGAAPLNGRIKGTERNEEAARWVEGGRGLAAPARSWSWRRLLRALCSSTCVRRSCDLPGRAVVARNGGLKLPSLQGSAPLKPPVPALLSAVFCSWLSSLWILLGVRQTQTCCPALS